MKMHHMAYCASRIFTCLLIYLLIFVQSLPASDGIYILSNKDSSPHIRLEIDKNKEAHLRIRGRYYTGKFQQLKISALLVFNHPNIPKAFTKIELKQDPRGLIDQVSRLWIPRAKILTTEDGGTPYTIHVSGNNNTPLNAFTYTYTIESKNGNWNPLLVKPIKSQGNIQINAPADCLIHLRINHPDRICGYGTQSQVVRKGGNLNDSTSIRMGLKITGNVIDKKTGKAIRGARVSPNIFTPPGFSPDRDRSVLTAIDGTFEIRGVDFSYTIEHPSYISNEVYLNDKKLVTPQTISLDPGSSVRGMVIATDNSPLAGVEIKDGAGKSCLSKADGSFRLIGLSKWAHSGKKWYFSFEKDGYNDQTIYLDSIGPDGIRVIMEPLPVFRGKIVDAQGNAIQNYQLICGPGKTPDSWECSTVNVADPGGKFSVSIKKLPEKGEQFWLGIRSEHHAPTEWILPKSKLLRGDVVLTLNDGLSLSGKISSPISSSKPLTLQVEPTDRLITSSMFSDETHLGKPLASQRKTIPRNGHFEVKHLRPGSYILKIHGSGVSPIIKSFKIGHENLDIGLLSLAGTGSIRGLVHHPFNLTEPWQFADGQVLIAGFNGTTPFDSFRQFKADAKGQFNIDDVPTGIVSVSFQYNLSADMITNISREVLVTEGNETEVRFNDPGVDWAQLISLQFGNDDQVPKFKTKRSVDNITDQEPSFRFVITPIGQNPASWPHEISWNWDDSPKPVIPDLSPGKWNIKVYDWLGSTGFDDGFLAETTFLADSKREPIRIQIGTHALTGKVTSAKETRRHIRVIAVPTNGTKCFYSRCDGDGNFIIRYIKTGDYQLYAHDDEGGWAYLGKHKTDDTVRDIGVHSLKPGGNLEGHLGRAALPDENIDICAKHSSGLIIPLDTLNDDGSFTFGHLKPGKWTILIRSGGQLLSEKTADVQLSQTTPHQ